MVCLFHSGKPVRDVDTRKRVAIRDAREWAEYRWISRGTARPRRVSVYVVDPGERRSLLYQCHYSAKLGRIVVEQL
jgi:hypothetical protein